jgi:hypothetical protein
VTPVDYRVWVSHFGQAFPVPGAASASVAVNDETADELFAQPNSGDATQPLVGLPLIRRSGSSTQMQPQRAESATAIMDNSTRAVDLLLAIPDLDVTDDAGDAGGDSSNGDRDGAAAAVEISPLAVDAALAGLAATF